MKKPIHFLLLNIYIAIHLIVFYVLDVPSQIYLVMSICIILSSTMQFFENKLANKKNKLERERLELLLKISYAVDDCLYSMNQKIKTNTIKCEICLNDSTFENGRCEYCEAYF